MQCLATPCNAFIQFHLKALQGLQARNANACSHAQVSRADQSARREARACLRDISGKPADAFTFDGGGKDGARGSRQHLMKRKVVRTRRGDADAKLSF